MENLNNLTDQQIAELDKVLTKGLVRNVILTGVTTAICIAFIAAEAIMTRKNNAA